MSEEDISDAEKIQICTGFLLSSPPGEFNEVVTDVVNLVGDEDLLNQHFASTAQEWNTEQMIAVDVPGGDYKVVISKYGEQDATHYLDPRGKQVLTIDHVKRTATAAEAGSDAGPLEDMRASIDAAMQEYVGDHYREGTSTVYGIDGDIVICISAAKFSPSNYWNGRWISTWTVKNAAQGSCTIEGNFKLAIHYYEDGNVQLNTETTKSLDVNLGDAGACGAQVKKAIARAENDYQSGIEETYKIMAERSFKGLRRRLPVTRHPMDWDKAVGFTLGKELAGK